MTTLVEPVLTASGFSDGTGRLPRRLSPPSSTASADSQIFVLLVPGEEGPPEYVWGALDALGAERIDHGVRALEDPDLVRRLVEEQVPLTVCPQSNLKLRVVSDLGGHPLKRMLDLGLNVSINSDDPAYFGAYLGDNYRQAATALGLGAEDITRLAKNSIDSSFAPKAFG